jgi:hypothetical protein
LWNEEIGHIYWIVVPLGIASFLPHCLQAVEDAKYLGVPVVNNKIWKEGTGWAAYRITASSGQITQHTSDTNRN